MITSALLSPQSGAFCLNASFKILTTSARRFSVHIPQKTTQKITSLLSQLPNSPYNLEDFNTLSTLSTQILRNCLASEVMDHIKRVKFSHQGFVEITGTPVDPNLMDTPIGEGDIKSQKKTYLAELFSMGMAGLMGQKIYNFRQEGWGTGDLIFNIYPKPQMLSLKGAGGTEPDFRFHMENAWHSQTPDSLILKGLRQDHDAAAITYVVANQAIYSRLTEAERDLLSTRLFKITPPEIHRRMEKEKGIIFSEDKDYVGPLIIKEATGYKFMINFNGMAAIDDKLAPLVKKVEQLSIELATSVKLRPDNLVLLNNNRVLHTRNGYKPRFDGKDRWFQRYFLAEPSKLWPSLLVEANHFTFLTDLEKETLFISLNAQGLLKNQKLTSKFTPHVANFSISLPAELEGKRTLIMKELIKKGPSFPHRVI